MWSETPNTKSTAHTQNEEYCSMAMTTPLTSYEPKQLDNSDDTETFALIFQNESTDKDTEPSCWCDAELDDELIGKALHLHHCWLRSEKSEQNTFTRHIFSLQSALMVMSHVTLAQGLLRVMSSMFHSLEWLCFLISLRLHFALFTVSLTFLFTPLIFIFIFHVARFGEKYPVRFREWGVWFLGQQHTSHKLWAHILRRLPLLANHWNFHPGVLQRQQASNLHDLEFSDYTIGSAFSSPLFIQEGADPASRRLAYHSLEKSLSSNHPLSVGHVRTVRRWWVWFAIFKRQRTSTSWLRNEQIRLLLERQR